MQKIALLFCVTFVVYCFSFGNHFVWDDEQFIVENVFVQDLRYWPEYFTTSTTAGAGIVSNYYRPLTTLSFAIDHAIWGMHPFGFHITNAMLHAFGAVLVFFLLRMLLRIEKKDGRWDVLAYSVTLAFSLHPAQVEAVVNINSRGDSLSLVYGLAGVLFLTKLASEQNENRRILLGVASFMAYAIALLSKESAMVWLGFSVVYLLARVLKRMTIRPGMVVAVVAQFLMTAVYFGLRFTILQFQSTQDIWGTASVYANSMFVRLVTFAFEAIPQYIEVLLWPRDLHMERKADIIQSVGQIHWQAWLVVALLISWLTFIVIRIKRLRTLTDPLILGTLILCIGIAPFAGIIPLNDIVYEHWLYVPMIGWWLVLFSLLLKVAPKRIYTLSIFGILVLWGTMSIKQILIWRTPITLYSHILQYNDSARIHLNLGIAYAEQHQIDRAIHEYSRAIELDDRYPQMHHNLANAYASIGKTDQAKEEFTKALRLDPTFRFSLAALIDLCIKTKDKKGAETWAEYAKEKLPNDPEFAILYSRVQSTQW